MTLQQAQNTLAQARQFENLNLDEFVSRVFPDRKDLENIELGQMSLLEFLSLSKRVFKQFIHEFEERENTVFLPYGYRHPQIGQTNVDAQIQNYIDCINGNNISAAENALIWLASYQIEYGFFKQRKLSIEGRKISELDKLAEKLNLIESGVLNKQKELDTLYLDLDTIKKETQNLINQKREELNQITTNLSTSNTQTTQINELLNKGTDQSSRLNTLLEQQEQNKVQADKKLVELQELYTSTNDKLNENVKTILSQIDNFKTQVEENAEHLKFVEGKRAFFEEREKYLNELIGREVGASLFETFKQRKVELAAPVSFWQKAVPVMSIATVLWIFFLFKNQTDLTVINEWWQAFAINTLKTIPAIFLLLFSINQYGKERNFQEEYAFKSAVALTIDAYAGRLNDLSNKDKLIMEAVLSVYKTPIEEKKSKLKASKNTTDMLKTMVETTSELVKKK